MTPAVEINHLVKEFRTSFRRQPLRAVDDVSLRIEPGEVYGLIGPNGSGKSTTMKALLGLVAPTSGTCAIFGHDSLKVDSRREVGFLPENPYFYKHLTGAETLALLRQALRPARHGAARTASTNCSSWSDLEDARDRRLGGYSKGMLQRIGLAQALVQEPRLLILDEPTAGVDPIGSRQIRDLILELQGAAASPSSSAPTCSNRSRRSATGSASSSSGRMVREGTLEELTAIEDQSEIVLRGADPEPWSTQPGRAATSADGSNWSAPAKPAPPSRNCSCGKPSTGADDIMSTASQPLVCQPGRDRGDRRPTPSPSWCA